MRNVIVQRAQWGALCLLALSCGGRAESSPGEADIRETDESIVGDELGPTLAPSEPPGSEAPGCISGAIGVSLVRGLSPAQEFDAISLVALDGEHYVQLVIEQWGEPCDSVAVGSSCLLELEDRQTGFYASGSQNARALIVTLDGAFESLGYNALREFLGEIDTPNEAAVMAWSEGWDVSCPGVLATEDGWIIVPQDTTCAGGRGWVGVTSDGTVSHSAHCERAAP